MHGCFIPSRFRTGVRYGRGVDELDLWVEMLVAEAPPLGAATRDLVAAVFRGTEWPVEAAGGAAAA